MSDIRDQTREFERALLALDHEAARRLLDKIPRDTAYIRTVEQVVVSSLERIGAGWEQGSVALSQVYMSGRICEDLLDTILPPGHSDRMKRPKVAVAVLEDHHVLGKRIVYSCLRAAGYDLKDYGHGLAVAELADKAGADGIEVLLVSTLMLSAALKIKDLRARIKHDNPAIHLIVGGAPFLFDAQLWRAVGADAMGRNATDAAAIIDQLLECTP
jgi:methanogenic corrinoid protein MtbC1